MPQQIATLINFRDKQKMCANIEGYRQAGRQMDIQLGGPGWLASRQCAQNLHFCLLPSLVVPPTIHTTTNSFSVLAGDAASIGCHVSGYPFPNMTTWCSFKSSFTKTCFEESSISEEWKAQWESRLVSESIPSGTLVLKRMAVSVNDNNTIFQCTVEGSGGSKMAVNVSLTVIGKCTPQPYQHHILWFVGIFAPVKGNASLLQSISHLTMW